jgi:hypothetical protein
MTMSYQITAFKVVSKNGNTNLEPYERNDLCTWNDIEKELSNLKELGCYVNINTYKIIKTGNRDVYVKM